MSVKRKETKQLLYWVYGISNLFGSLNNGKLFLYLNGVGAPQILVNYL